MSRQAKSYWLAVIIAGCTTAAISLAHWRLRVADLPLLALYLFAAIATSGAKVRIPVIESTLTMNYVFILAGLIDLQLAECLLIATCGVLVQTYYKPETKPRIDHLIFNLSTIWLSVATASLCFHYRVFASLDRFGIVSIVTASLTYFTVNTLLVSGIIGLTAKKPIFALWKESYRWSFPQYVAGGIVAACFRPFVDFVGWAGVLCAVPVLYLMHRSYTIYVGRLNQQQKHIGEMEGLHLRTIEALALAIDAKDDTTSAHLRRVRVYASALGRELGLSPLELQAVEAAALLHDIGKLAVPEHIISKPGRLTPDEFEKMKIHPIVGAEILERVNFPYPVVPIVRAHHEKFDGTGYPDGLKGEEIPIGARILSAVDCLDALASDRQYRSALPLDEAIRIVIGESGKSYDPAVVAILAAHYQELELKARSENVEAAKVSSHVKVQRGASPAAGFASDGDPVAGGNRFRMSISDARREFQTLVEIANDLGSSLSLDETLALLGVRLAKAIPHETVVIWVRDGDKLMPRHVKGASYKLFSSLQVPIGQGLSGWVAETQKPILNGNPAVEAGYLNDSTQTTTLRSALAVPLVAREQVVGVLTLYQSEPDAFTLDHRRILQNISCNVGAVIDNALRLEQAQDAARIDELTGLLNAKSLFACLASEVTACSQNARSLAVIVMDLDGFKKANDEHGHLAGNRILQNVANGLKKCCRSNDVLARLGGDEFVMVLSNPGKDLQDLMERIDDVGRDAGAEVNYMTPVSISAGCAFYPADALDAESLLERADEQMYEEKRRRKAQMTSQVIVFPKSRVAARR